MVLWNGSTHRETPLKYGFLFEINGKTNGYGSACRRFSFFLSCTVAIRKTATQYEKQIKQLNSQTTGTLEQRPSLSSRVLLWIELLIGHTYWPNGIMRGQLKKRSEIDRWHYFNHWASFKTHHYVDYISKKGNIQVQSQLKESRLTHDECCCAQFIYISRYSQVYSWAFCTVKNIILEEVQ